MTRTIAFLIAMTISPSLQAQGYDQVLNAEPINVDGYLRDRPEPIQVDASASASTEGGGYGADFGAMAALRGDPGASAGTTAAQAAALKRRKTPTMPVEMAGKTYQVRFETYERFQTLLEEALLDTQLGTWGLTFAAALNLWGLLTPDPGSPAGLYDLANKIKNGTETIDEVVLHLQGPTLWANNVRSTTIRMLYLEIARAKSQGDHQGAAWLQEVLRMMNNPTRLRSGGIRYEDGKLIIRNPPAESYRNRVAFELSDGDWRSLNHFIRDIDADIGARQLLADTEIYWSVATLKKPKSISERDLAFIGAALSNMCGLFGQRVYGQIQATAHLPDTTTDLWVKLASLFNNPRNFEKMPGSAGSYVTDSTGLTEDLPKPSEFYVSNPTKNGCGWKI